MNGVAICTDSSALLPIDAVLRLGINVVPIAITLDGEPFDDRGDAIDDFYVRLSEGARAATSQPSPGEFLEAYARVQAHGGNEVLSIHLDARVSGTLASAELAAREAPIPVTIVDTRTVSFGVGLCVRAAAKALAGGASATRAAEAARSIHATLGNVFVAPMASAGRLPDEAGWSLLGFVEGTIVPGAACDGLDEAIDAMAARVLEGDGPVRVAVGHAGPSIEPAADALALSLVSRARVASVERYRLGAAIGAHTGPNCFGVFWWPSP